MLFVQWLRYGTRVECLRNGSARMQWLYAHAAAYRSQYNYIAAEPKERRRQQEGGRERERDRTTEREKERWGSAGERDIERERDIRIYVWNTCAHTFMHTFAAPWCTVEREYKRLKAKRKQTGSSLSKPNSGWGRGVKLRHAAVGSPSERASERGNFLSFVSHYISALLF